MLKPQKYLKLLRKQLDVLFNQERSKNISTPKPGWIKTLREALGMSQVEFAKKMGIAPQTAAQLEASERKGSISLSSLKKVADVLNCESRVILVPRQSLEKTIQEQAYKKAKKLVERTQLHMNLEAQGTHPEFRKNQIQEIAEELLQKPGRGFWRED